MQFIDLTTSEETPTHGCVTNEMQMKVAHDVVYVILLVLLFKFDVFHFAVIIATRGTEHIISV